MLGRSYHGCTAEAYVAELERLIARGSPPSLRSLEGLFGEFLAVVGAPAPEGAVYSLFLNVDVLSELARALPAFALRDDSLREHVEKIPNGITRVTTWQQSRGRESYYRVRPLGVLGTYPNIEITSRYGSYLIRGGSPYLVTRNSPRQDMLWGFPGGLSDWTRQETRLATALSCTEWGGFLTYLEAPCLDFSTSKLQHLPEDRKVDFMLAFLALVNAIDQPSRERTDFGSDTRPRFEFSDFRLYRSSARAFAADFVVSHPLLLRTACHYLKASMLWKVQEFAEEALANVFFALEGCLLLHQEKEGASAEKLDRKILRAVFRRTYDHGDGLFDFIEDAMGWGGTRASIVHPQLSLEYGWNPPLEADDYYEYHQIVRALLMFLVTGDTFEDYRRNPPGT
jgi:hypothetical protein